MGGLVLVVFHARAIEWLEPVSGTRVWAEPMLNGRTRNWVVVREFVVGSVVKVGAFRRYKLSFMV